MNRASLLRYRLRLEALEDRCTPSTAGVFSSHGMDLAKAAVLPGTAAAAQANDSRVVPFKITGGGPAPDGLPLFSTGTAPHQATGTATALGAYTGSGTFELGSLTISATGAVTASFQGSFVFVAANGDKLAVTYGDGFSAVFTGQLSADGTSVTNGKFDAFFTPDPGHSTGRFANVIGGGWEMIAKAPLISLISTVPGYTAPFNYTWSGEGTLVYGKGNGAGNGGPSAPQPAQAVAIAPWVAADAGQTSATDWATSHRARVE
jgi:hypothetical protein